MTKPKPGLAKYEFYTATKGSKCIIRSRGYIVYQNTKTVPSRTWCKVVLRVEQILLKIENKRNLIIIVLRREYQSESNLYEGVSKIIKINVKEFIFKIMFCSPSYGFDLLVYTCVVFTDNLHM